MQQTTSGAAGNGLNRFERHAEILRRRRKPIAEIFVDNTAKLRPQASVFAPPKQRATSSAPVIGMCTTIKYMRGAAGIGLGTTIKYLRRTTSAAANGGLGTTIKYLEN
jgi:hypothetical protein